MIVELMATKPLIKAIGLIVAIGFTQIDKLLNPSTLSSVFEWSIAVGLLTLILYLLFKEYKLTQNALDREREKVLEMNDRTIQAVTKNTEALREFSAGSKDQAEAVRELITELRTHRNKNT